MLLATALANSHCYCYCYCPWLSSYWPLSITPATGHGSLPLAMVSAGWAGGGFGLPY